MDEEMENMNGNIFRLEEFKVEADAAKAGKETGSSHEFSPHIHPCLQESVTENLTSSLHHIMTCYYIFLQEIPAEGQIPPVFRYMEPGHICPPVGGGPLLPAVFFPPRRDLCFPKWQQVLFLTVISLTSMPCRHARQENFGFPAWAGILCSAPYSTLLNKNLSDTQPPKLWEEKFLTTSQGTKIIRQEAKS